MDLTTKINSLQLPPAFSLISFDVTNLFPSIPSDQCLQIISEYLLASDLSDDQVLCILALLKLSVQQNFFKFNNVNYAQLDGLAMGSNLSPILAEIFMNYLEKSFITNLDFYNKHIIFWGRYVDDILCIHTSDGQNIQAFLSELNLIHHNIKFTYEYEQNGQLPFLDVLLHKREQKKIEFSIYRKPTTTDSLIPFDSVHPYSHKISGLNSLLRRMLSIPMSASFYQKEWNIIQQIGMNNGYSPKLIACLLRKIKNKIQLQSHQVGSYLTPINQLQDISVFRSLPYFPNISYSIKNIFSKYNVTISFSNPNVLGKSLVKNKDVINILDKSGIYQLLCGTCSAFYIGQTGRSFSTRFKEHSNCIKLNNLTHKSAFADHILHSGHSFDRLMNFKILHLCHKGQRLNVLENLEISKHKQNKDLVNEITDLRNDLISSICI
ncbi:hypothetical protein RI129_007701 [Pyrocoelia pectoralis]|uniref:Reverse transcriptase domain-containing protein n=1 Tax=Pyrocoelia pectoralis TaxID=417401 RepID=A0AAN7VE29_9COLE